MAILSHIINILFPSVCRQCGDPVSAEAPTAYFCSRCWDSITWFDGPCCPCCGMPYPVMDPSMDTSPLKGGVSLYPGHLCGDCSKSPPSFDRAISAGPYEGVLAEAIKLFKYKKKVHIGRALAEQMISFPPFYKGGTSGFSGESSPYYLIPVPLHPKRLREREFNQSAIIASEIEKRLGIPVLTDILIRQHHTKSQVELDMKERRRNVVGAFTARNEDVIKDKNLILVDDVYTTGSTVNECAKTLKRNGAGKVYVVTIARMVG